MCQGKKEKDLVGIMNFPKFYQGVALIADPIHRYAFFTVPMAGERGEKTEKDLIDSPWLQRLRRIYQLQSARWVYPAAEHTRFQHSLGAMHLAGEFARSLWQSLKDVYPGTPSLPFVEELLRLAGLLHDVGHGPYGHFFDEHFLSDFSLTHEDVGQKIIVDELGSIISRIRRSPSGWFEEGERLDPRHVAFLIKADGEGEASFPPWLLALRQLFSGIYTVDNLDYVQRDAYMTGFSLDMVDIDRLKYYTFFAPEGLSIHEAGISALRRFLNARFNLYAHVYFHRTTRALDMHLKEIFHETIKGIFPHNPLEALSLYLSLDEWSLFSCVRNWLADKDPKRRRLGREWMRLYNREVKWKMAYAAELSIDRMQKGIRFASAEEYEKLIRASLPTHMRRMVFRVDLATQDPRPINPMVQSDKSINIFNPSTGQVSPEPLLEIYRYIPARVVHFRIFALRHTHDAYLAMAAEKALGEFQSSVNTNI
ncbi:MAG TPA: HD domain-containing protein [Syntrophales bacterium]|nr:HD domain-containing protein [Syntrophales bacterium]HOL59447.1 HD domain-containing protein [Syntrophales bacterium]HPO34629.1 HD domain-containing protein [Syntrophales bacterium]